MRDKIKQIGKYLRYSWKDFRYSKVYTQYVGSNISAEMILDSQYKKNRVSTLVLKYPRFIHSEFMTHRVFSRNSSSSRAISIDKNIQQIVDNPAIPIIWGRDTKGMRANDWWGGTHAARCKDQWIHASLSAVRKAKKLQEMELHKQIVNRVLEPFQMMETIVTSTEWANFLELRTSEEAQPEIQALALCIQECLRKSKPIKRNLNEWHIPFISWKDYLKCLFDTLILGKRYKVIIISVARCARVSYLSHVGKKIRTEKDIILYDGLLRNKHMSPFEHQAQFLDDICSVKTSNLKNVLQYRKCLE